MGGGGGAAVEDIGEGAGSGAGSKRDTKRDTHSTTPPRHRLLRPMYTSRMSTLEIVLSAYLP